VLDISKKLFLMMLECILFHTPVDSVLLDDKSICYQNPLFSVTQVYLISLDYFSQSQFALQLSCPFESMFSSPIKSLNFEKTNLNMLTLAYAYNSDSLFLNDTVLYADTVKHDDLGLIKFRDNGEIVFSKRFPARSILSANIASLPDGKIALAGIFAKDSIVLGDYHLHCIGCNVHDSEVFLAVLDSLGNVLNAKRFGGNTWDYAEDLTSDAEGNIYLTGTTYSQYFMADSVVMYNSGFGLNSDAFLLKLNSNLDLIWTKHIHGIYTQKARRLAGDNEGNIYLSGTISSTMALIGSDTLWGSLSYSTPYLLKISQDGILEWSRVFPSQSTNCTISDINVDAGNNIWLSINYNGTLDVFGNALITNNYLDNALIQVNPDGAYKQMYIIENTTGQQIVPLDDDRLFIVGHFCCNGSLTFLNMTLSSLDQNDQLYYYFTLQLPPVTTVTPGRAESVLSIHPNPLRCGALLNVDFTGEPQESPGRIQVYDCLGRPVAQYDWAADSITLQLPCVLQPGVYFISFQAEEALFTQKLIVID